jgi:ABC-type iron transport system FetAB ATPase subunit
MTLYFSDQERQSYDDSLKETHFHSQLNFLNAHNGLRRKSMHLLLGTTGGGKSTMVRTLLRDIIFNPKNDTQLCVWLSEESSNDYRSQVAYGLPSHDRLLKTQLFSELETEKLNEKTFREWLDMFKPDVFIFDNITTSALYNDKNAKEQASFVTMLKKLTVEYNMATILVAHTDAKATDTMGRLINLNDVRGSKSVANLVEFAYILQRFEIGTTYFSTIRVEKHRSQELKHKLFSLQYNNQLRSFISDIPIQFEKFREMYKERNKLDK